MMIDRNHALPVSRQAKLLDISRGAVYYVPKPISEADLKLMRHIDELHLQHPFMGARMLRRTLAQEGVTRANQVWALDTTYIPMAQGFVYLTAVVDVASRRVLAHKLATTLEAHHAVEIMAQALTRYGTPEIVNTDQGSQFTATEFVAVLTKIGAALSMDGKGAWRDNVFVERLWRTVKYERVYLKTYDTVSEARADLAEYLNWYNLERAHSSVGDLTPDQAYWQMLPPMERAA